MPNNVNVALLQSQQMQMQMQNANAVNAVNVIAAVSALLAAGGSPPPAGSALSPQLNSASPQSSTRSSAANVRTLKKRLWRWYAFLDEAIDDGAASAELEPIKSQIARTEQMLAAAAQGASGSSGDGGSRPQAAGSGDGTPRRGWASALKMGCESSPTTPTRSPRFRVSSSPPGVRSRANSPRSPMTPEQRRTSSPGPSLPPGLPPGRLSSSSSSSSSSRGAESSSVESALDAMRAALDACSEISTIIEQSPRQR